MTERERHRLQQSLGDAWMSILGVLSGPDGETNRVAQWLLQAVGLGGGVEAGRLVQELTNRVRQNQKALQERVDAAVRAAVARVKGPLAKQIDELRRRAEQVRRRLDRRQRRKGKEDSSPEDPAE
jgi:hypothetical protein